jgi:hypothetical protein
MEPSYRIWRDTVIELELDCLFADGPPSREDVAETLLRAQWAPGADYERRLEQLGKGEENANLRDAQRNPP